MPKVEREPEDGPADWAINMRYDAEYGARHRKLHFLSPDTLLANSTGWHRAPKLDRFKRISKEGRYSVGERLGRNLRSLILEQQRELAALSPTPPPTLVCVEKAYVSGFLAGMARPSVDENDSVHGDEIEIPASSIVLLLVNGGDEPVTVPTMTRLAEHPWLAVCFATNLHVVPLSLNPARFRPLPLGAMPNNKACSNEAILHSVRASALPWNQHDSRLLVPPMAMKSRSRRNYLNLLSQPQFAHLVVVYSDPKRLNFEAFMTLISKHRAVLSPPGSGYDCFRTWQVLAVGAVPLIVHDPAFDLRLFDDTGAVFAPSLSELTPESLASVLGTVVDPATCAEDSVELESWLQKFMTAKEGLPLCLTDMEDPSKTSRGYSLKASEECQQHLQQRHHHQHHDNEEREHRGSSLDQAKFNDNGAAYPTRSMSFFSGCIWMGPCLPESYLD